MISLGAVFATTSVLIVFQLASAHLLLDGATVYCPSGRRCTKYRTPHITTILTGVLVAVFAGVANINEVVELTNIGTLFAFVLVCFGVTILRYREPERPRAFKVWGGAWLVPMLGAASCLFLMFYLPPASWWRFFGWLVLGMSVYFSYGYQNSTVGREGGRSPFATGPQKLLAFGTFLVACGLFVIPHDAGPMQLFHEMVTSSEGDHTRALVGMSLIGVGLLGAIAGAFGGSSGDGRAPAR